MVGACGLWRWALVRWCSWQDLVPGSRPRTARARPSQAGKVPFIYQKKRSFRIPFHIDEQGRARLKEVQLWVSEDSGFHWEGKSTATPDLGKFTFRASHDGEYWFATRTITVDGQYSPPMNQEVEPSMKVVIDTVAAVDRPGAGRPARKLGVGPLGGQGRAPRSQDRSSLEYQADGAREWRRVPIRRPVAPGRGDLGRGHGRFAAGSGLGRRQGGECRGGADRPAGRYRGRRRLRGRGCRIAWRLRSSRFPGPARRSRKARDSRRSRRIRRRAPASTAAGRPAIAGQSGSDR